MRGRPPVRHGGRRTGPRAVPPRLAPLAAAALARTTEGRRARRGARRHGPAARGRAPPTAPLEPHAAVAAARTSSRTPPCAVCCAGAGGALVPAPARVPVEGSLVGLDTRRAVGRSARAAAANRLRVRAAPLRLLAPTVWSRSCPSGARAPFIQ